MFNLPEGKPIEGTISVESGSIQPFDHGVISTWVGRRKTPAGHRLVRAGRIVAWLAESGKGKLLLAGKEARLRLEDLESTENSRYIAGEYSLAGLGSVAEVVPEAFEHAADRQGCRDVRPAGHSQRGHRAQADMPEDGHRGARRYMERRGLRLPRAGTVSCKEPAWAEGFSCGSVVRVPPVTGMCELFPVK